MLLLEFIITTFNLKIYLRSLVKTLTKKKRKTSTNLILAMAYTLRDSFFLSFHSSLSQSSGSRSQRFYGQSSFFFFSSLSLRFSKITPKIRFNPVARTTWRVKKRSWKSRWKLNFPWSDYIITYITAGIYIMKVRMNWYRLPLFYIFFFVDLEIHLNKNMMNNFFFKTF